MKRPSKGNSSSERGPAPDPGAALLTVHGWRIGFHPQLLLQLETLIEAVERERRRHRDRIPSAQPAQILAALRKLIFEDVPQDPARPAYRQGSTLGPARRHWFRAKFGAGRYRLFFRFHTADRVLLFAWVNDEQSLRTYGSSTDAYAVFARMLGQGNPPDDWDALLVACTTTDSLRRLGSILQRFRGGES
jgi:toxin YhaV